MRSQSIQEMDLRDLLYENLKRRGVNVPITTDDRPRVHVTTDVRIRTGDVRVECVVFDKERAVMNRFYVGTVPTKEMQFYGSRRARAERLAQVIHVRLRLQGWH